MNQRGFGEQQMPEIKLPNIPGSTIRVILLLLLVVATLLSSFFTVGPEETGIVLRFGKYQRSTGPGLNFRFPLGIERVVKVPVQRQLKEEFGFRTVRTSGRGRGTRSQYETARYLGESDMLTGDLNAAVVEWVVQYRIVDPISYLFRVRNVRQTFRDMSEATMRSIVGDRTVNEVLTVGRQEIADLVFTNLQGLCDQYFNGIKVDQVVLQDVNPPDPVKPSFNDVNEAQQEKERRINEAQSEYNQEIPRAEGRALQTIQQAEGYFLDRTNRARGDSARFVSLYTEYRKAPNITRRRLYLETMNVILPQIGQKIIVDKNLKGILPLLNIGPGRLPITQGGGN